MSNENGHSWRNSAIDSLSRSCGVTFICSLCVVEEDGITDKVNVDDLITLTIIDGQLVCMYHMGYAVSLVGSHSTMRTMLRRDNEKAKEK